MDVADHDADSDADDSVEGRIENSEDTDSDPAEPHSDSTQSVGEPVNSQRSEAEQRELDQMERDPPTRVWQKVFIEMFDLSLRVPDFQ